MQAELMENLGPKEQIQDQAKFIRQDLDSLRKEHRLARAEYDAIDKEISKLNVAIEELQQHYKKADDAQREAFTLMKELRSKENLKNDGFYQNRRDAQNARDLASQKKVKEVEVLCTKQVEDFMHIWNMDSKFRSEYLKSNERSTVRRLETLDGRALGPGEKSPVLSEDILPLKLNDTKHVAETPAAEAPKITNSSVSGVELSNGSIFKEPKQGKPSSLHEKEDENETAGSRDVKLKSKQINTSENIIESETHAAEQKEKVRQEQIAKAKEAEERKRRRSEKQESRALARAKKDAERKEKEREKKAQKKSGASGTNTIPESVEEFSDEKTEADVRPEAAGSDEATTLVNPVRDRKVVATRRKLPVKDAKPVKPVLSKRSLKKKSWPAPLWAIASILVLVLLVAVLIFMKL
ncbi:hypothetical protein KP509_30G028400 [Ceratopteris richardii]|nr:hypothetical protein KP509_30G028400 [Ceratopteris richardii]